MGSKDKERNKIERARNLGWTGKMLEKKEEGWMMWIQLRRKRKEKRVERKECLHPVKYWGRKKTLLDG